MGVAQSLAPPTSVVPEARHHGPCFVVSAAPQQRDGAQHCVSHAGGVLDPPDLEAAPGQAQGDGRGARRPGGGRERAPPAALLALAAA
eukprot:4862697-Pyramimonas_sp.AAC.1